jgi:hypothetical protein
MLCKMLIGTLVRLRGFGQIEIFVPKIFNVKIPYLKNMVCTKSSLRKFSQFDMSTSNSDSSRGSLSAGVGKEGEDLGKLRKESSRNAPDHDDHF